jgi:type VI secretion system protein ImpF
MIMRPDPHQGLMPSLLDRLTDPDAGGTTFAEGYTVAQMTQAVLRDLDDLLNTRLAVTDVPPDCKEVVTSIAAYGLPDFSNIPAGTSEQRSQIGRLLETVLARFEPRLRDIKATMVEDPRLLKRSVKFLLSARLVMDPSPEVAFNTILELTTGRSTVTAAEEPGR